MYNASIIIQQVMELPKIKKILHGKTISTIIVTDRVINFVTEEEISSQNNAFIIKDLRTR